MSHKYRKKILKIRRSQVLLVARQSKSKVILSTNLKKKMRDTSPTSHCRIRTKKHQKKVLRKMKVKMPVYMKNICQKTKKEKMTMFTEALFYRRSTYSQNLIP